MTPDLLTIVQQAQQGDRRALGRLYEQFAPLVRTVCFDQSGDYQAVGDLVHDVFLSVVGNLRQLDQPERFRSWLIGIARRKAVDCVRSRIRLRRLSESSDEESAESAIPARPVVDPTHQESLRLLREAVSTLQEQERLAVHLFHLEELPVQQVSEIMDLPRSTVYATLIRARARLKERLTRAASVRGQV